jgi:Cysteine-rich secretory protein family
MSNHVLVNRERKQRGMRPLQRSQTLDLVAGMWAHVMAAETSLFHAADDIDSLKELLQSDAAAENIQRGPCIQAMHDAAMERQTSTRANILSRNFDEFGYVEVSLRKAAPFSLSLSFFLSFAHPLCFLVVLSYRMGTARGADGKIYMVQFFRRKPAQQVNSDIPSSPEYACKHHDALATPTSCEPAISEQLQQQQQQQVWQSSNLTIYLY